MFSLMVTAVGSFCVGVEWLGEVGEEGEEDGGSE